MSGRGVRRAVVGHTSSGSNSVTTRSTSEIICSMTPASDCPEGMEVALNATSKRNFLLASIGLLRLCRSKTCPTEIGTSPGPMNNGPILENASRSSPGARPRSRLESVQSPMVDTRSWLTSHCPTRRSTRKSRGWRRLACGDGRDLDATSTGSFAGAVGLAEFGANLRSDPCHLTSHDPVLRLAFP